MVRVHRQRGEQPTASGGGDGGSELRSEYQFRGVLGDLRSYSLEPVYDTTVRGYVYRKHHLYGCAVHDESVVPVHNQPVRIRHRHSDYEHDVNPFGTKPQSGTCTLNFYGQNNPAAFVTGVIPSGNSWTPAVGAWMASTIAPNFEGYMIAVCNFQLAHGYSFVSDLGAQKLAHGSLALVLPGTSSRPAPTPNR